MRSTAETRTRARGPVPEWIQHLLPIGPVERRRIGSSGPKVWHVPVQFRAWSQHYVGIGPPRVYGKTPLVDSAGALTVGEVELASRMQAGGWRAKWTDAFGNAPAVWRDLVFARDAEWPAECRGYEALAERWKRRGGWPDVVAWQESGTPPCIFIEYKGPRDHVRASQLEWLELARTEVDLDRQFVIAEWSGPPTKTTASEMQPARRTTGKSPARRKA